MSHTKKGDWTMQVARIGFDMAKSSFQVQGVDAQGKVIIRKQLSRGQVWGYFAQLPPSLSGLEACSGAHYGARKLGKRGHDGELDAKRRGDAGKLTVAPTIELGIKLPQQIDHRPLQRVRRHGSAGS